ncbi:DUF4175 domain-containing protein [Acetobacteraceae bacterium KSS8]|uniref:DUF4175 domain-containing protein n=1 Tax=Endosaccharibacter trunci TaxID=2812733 RepID=A0ABT1W2Q1_9PROT|nr:DUF4175 domain-containing protein [Acetobacteraceae bacterium KSS8]
MSRDTDLLRRTRRRAGLVLSIEQLWPALLPALFLLGCFALSSLLTLPQRLPSALRWLAVLAVLGGAAILVRRAVRGLRSPTTGQRDRRIERASRLSHRPLTTLLDRPVTISAGADGVWAAHLDRTQAGLRNLSAGSPRLAFRAHDRRGFGAALLAGLLVAALLSGTDAPRRLLSGFWPGLALPIGPHPVLQAWITPPPYAGGAPVFLSDPHGRYEVPAGSTLSVSLSGSAATPHLDGVSGRFANLSERSWSFSGAVPATGADGIAVHVRESGYALADWRVVSQKAGAPVVAWTAPPGADKTVPWRLRLPWSAAQRYGIRSLQAEIRLADGTDHRVLQVRIPLGGTPDKARGVALEDLSADPWAGAKVVARLVATDTAGQTAESADAAFTLPERPFRNPLARAVLDLRRRLATGTETPRDAAGDLAALGDTPGQIAQDSGSFLNLSAVASLLQRFGERPGTVAEASDRLWSLALALEDGLHNDRAGARATAEIRRAQERLSAQIEHMRQLGQAGQNPSEQDELHKRIAALAQAIRRKMQALAEQAAREHRPMPALPESVTAGGDALDRMLKQMQEQAANGHGDQAMQDLSRMQQMLDHMRLATPQDLRSAAEQAQATAEARDQMQAVQDLVKRQTALLDSTQNRQGLADRARAEAQRRLETDGEDTGADQGGAPDAATRALLQQLGIPLDDNGASGSPAPEEAQRPPAGAAQTAAPSANPSPDQDAARTRDAHDQTVLARALGELQQEFTGLTGKKADGLADAEKNMRDARDALSNKDDAAAAQAEAKALAALQKGRNQMGAAMRGGRSGGTGLALLPGGGDGTGDDAGEPGDNTGQADSGENGDGIPGDAAELGSDESKGPRDPLGRPTGDNNGRAGDGSETHVPDGDSAARSRQIENEIRRRDSDRTRPQSELDYLDRLLRAF